MTTPTRFTLFRKNNPCPLCDSTDGRCKETADGLILCMSLTDAIEAPGYRFRGRTKDQTWGLWAVDDPATASQYQPRQRPERHVNVGAGLRLIHGADRQYEIKTCPALPVATRDHYYRQMVAQLSLHPDDRADLNRRGFTDQRLAELGWFVSFTKRQPIGTFPKNLPGIFGNCLATNYDGHLCAIPDADGRIQAFQCHNRQGPKYTWLSTRRNPAHLPSGQLPVGVYWPQTLTVTHTVGIAEGYAIKPQLAADRLGMVVLSADNANMAGRPDEFQRQLEQVKTLLQTDALSLLIFPDAGDVKNHHVCQRNRNNEHLYDRLGLTYRYAWWGQVDKTHPDIDEIAANQSIRYLSREEFWAIVTELAPPWWHQLKAILKLGNRQQRRRVEQLLKRQQLGTDLLTTNTTIYQPDERLKLWCDRIQAGEKFIFDASETGTGKSYTAGQLTPERCGASKLLYISSQHRNPTVETLTSSNGWTDLEARHAGLTRTTKPNGESRLQRAEAGQATVIPANCSRNFAIGALRDKYVVGSDSAKLICGTCPLREKCTHSTGPGFGFLYQRQLALASSKVRLHPDSLPDPKDFDYRDVVIIWEEISELFKPYRVIKIDLTDLRALILHLAMDYTPIFTALQPWIDALSRLLEQPHGRYGLEQAAILAGLPPLPDLDLDELRAILAPDLSLLNTTEAYGIDLADLPSQLRRSFSDRDPETAQQIQQQVVKQWLPELLQVLQGSTGSLHIQQGVLTLMVPNDRLRQVAQAAKSNLALDATLNPTDLALLLGCHPDNIYTCQQTPHPTPNLNLIQVYDLGRLGMQRGQEQERRAHAVINALWQQDPTTQVIDFKKFAEPGQGIWWGDSRGSNDFIGTNTLVLKGTPCPNLATLQAEWRILTQTEPEGTDFEAWVNRKIEADIRQGIGRPRAHLRPEQPIMVVLLSDFPLTIPTTLMPAAAITPAAAGKKEAKIMAMRQAFQQLREAGEKATQQAVADLTGLARGTVNRLWQSAIVLLLKAPIAKRSCSEPESELQLAEAVAAIEQLANAPPRVLLQQLERLWQAQMTPDLLPWVWERLPYSTQVAIWRALGWALTPEQRQQLLLEVT